ncbi:uncharacterized protein FIBRA_05649 [Fibroporia radiculosa]|uniref:BTB domain-containing protein n=1 Tax=Fibroporia radiculosa TaxID=599839 RepID=J4GRE0_9APHY|nr:uncharacterized protein FIBRA_05649 [Fibroporia radiculosa]CCM03515.1 predicted protein [Fibroporia radiculosa]
MNQPVSYERGDPWFDDGNIVLLADGANVAFKVHRGILSRHSDIFQTMFQLPPPQADVEMLDDCHLVRMYDLPVELSNLIKALYDGATFQNRSGRDFCDLAGVLRLSTKYFIMHLRKQAIRFLSQTWSHTLRGHDEMLEAAIKSPLVDGTTYPYVHPLHVLNLARETNVRILVPSALYFLSLYPLDSILRRDHPKLQIDHPSCPSSELSPQDLKEYTLMFQHRIDVILDFVRRVCGQRKAAANCKNDDSGACLKAFSRLCTTLSRSWMVRTGPLHFMVQAIDELSSISSVCMPCRRVFREDVLSARQEVWKGLPAVIGIPGWDDLEATDLNF